VTSERRIHKCDVTQSDEKGMAPVSERCSVLTSKLNRQPPECVRSVRRQVPRRSVTTDAPERRRHHVVRHVTSWSQLRRDDWVQLAASRQRSADAEVSVQRGRHSVSLRRSHSGVQQRHLMTCLYCAALVDDLALQLSQLRLQTDVQTSYNDDKQLALSSCSPAADYDDGDVLAAGDDDKPPSEDWTSSGSGLSVDTTRLPASHDRQPCPVDNTSSMSALLRRSCRIPRPVSVPVPRRDVTRFHLPIELWARPTVSHRMTSSLRYTSVDDVTTDVTSSFILHAVYVSGDATILLSVRLSLIHLSAYLSVCVSAC